MNLDSIKGPLGETRLERVVGLIGIIAWTVAVPSLLLHPEGITFKIAWAVAFLTIAGWNLLVFMRRRRTGSRPG